MTRSLTFWLEKFNRKERFHLLAWALERPHFELGETFRRTIETELKGELRASIPDDAFVAMDYHLNWIYAALVVASHGGVGRTFENPLVLDDHRMIRGNQEDLDLVVAFGRPESEDVILVEAKGDSGWSKEQLESKAVRLNAIFPQGRYRGVVAYFVLTSPGPKRPGNIDQAATPPWMRPGGRFRWVPLPWPSERERVFRSRASGHACADGEHWTRR